MESQSAQRNESVSERQSPLEGGDVRLRDVSLKRVYEEPDSSDGLRVLVDKLGREDMLELGRLSNILADVADEVKPVKPADSPTGPGGSVPSHGSVDSEDSVVSPGAGGSQPSDCSADSEGPAPSGESADAPDSRAG